MKTTLQTSLPNPLRVVTSCFLSLLLLGLLWTWSGAGTLVATAFDVPAQTSPGPAALIPAADSRLPYSPEPTSHLPASTPLRHNWSLSAIDDIPCSVTPQYIQQAAEAWGTDDATYDVYPYPPEEPDGKVDIRDVQFLILYLSVPCYPDGLERLNYHRTMAQVPAVAEDRFLDLGAALHAHYMAVNQVLSHGEDPGKPAYTELGDRCGGSSNLFGGASDMPNAVDVFMGAALHRYGQLHPKLRRVGMGLEEGWAAVDILQGVESVDWTDWPVVYPGPGQTDVPLAGSNEHDSASTCTDSVTGQSASPPANPGYPITLQFDWWSSPAPVADNVSFTRDGTPVPHVLCVPPDDSYFSMMILFPKEPLQPGQTYRVSVSGRYPAGTFSRSWSFTTTASPTTLYAPPAWRNP